MVNPNTNKIYISYTHSNFIIIVNLNSESIESKLSARIPKNIVLNHVTNKVYVSSADGIYEIDALTNKSEVINFGVPYPHGTIDVNQVTNTLYTTSFGCGDTIMLVDLSKRILTDKIVVSKKSRFSPEIRLHGIAVNSSENKVYILNQFESSIRMLDFEQSDRAIHTIKLNESISPKFILVNELSNLLYVKGTFGTSGGTWHEKLLVFDLDTKKPVQFEKAPSHSPQGFAYNRISNTLYMKKYHEMSILKFDAYVKKIIHTTTLQKRTFWQWFYESFYHFANVIAVNPSTNKVYVSDSKNSLLYEIEG